MADVTGTGSPSYVVIREIYEDSSPEVFENELDRALYQGVETIVIEPVRLGDETARWITLGNFLHKTAVLAGLGCVTSYLLSAAGRRAGAASCSSWLTLPLGVCSATCAGVYALSWQFDPCCKYQLETSDGGGEGPGGLRSRVPLHVLSCSSPVVLVRKDDARRKMLHNALALAAVLCCSMHGYRWLQPGRP